MPEPDGVSTALILVGGLGTRLRSVVSDRPKPLAAVAGRPFVCRILDQVAEAGLKEVVLCTGHLGEHVREALGTRHGPLALRYSQETTPLGTAGALRLAEPLAEGHTVLALNGDSYFGLPLEAYLDWHWRLGLDRSLVIRRVEDGSRYGRVEADDQGRVTSFREKSEGPGPCWINAGLYLIDRTALRSLPPDRALSLEREILPGWLGRLRAFRADGPFLDIGTPESLASAEGFFRDAGKA